MSRAEKCDEKVKAENLKRVTITMEELKRIKRLEAKNVKGILMMKNEEVFKRMLIIATNILIADFWPKSAKKRIPEFIERCMSLYESWEKGVVTMDEMQRLTEEYAGIKLVKQGAPTDVVLKERARKKLR